jgi:uncharacterized membrane protein YhaH (DUF805 family)
MSQINSDLSGTTLKYSSDIDTKSKDWMSFDGLIDRLKYYYTTYPFFTIVVFILHIVVCIIAVMLAMECNQYESAATQVIVAIVAFLFGEIYIIYYAMYHIFIGVRCYSPPVYGSISRYSSLERAS